MKKNEDGKTFLYVFKKATKNGRFFAAKNRSVFTIMNK